MSLSRLSTLFLTVAVAASAPAHATFSSASSSPPPPPPPSPPPPPPPPPVPGSSQFYPVYGTWVSGSGVKPYNVQFAAPKSGDWLSTGSPYAWLWTPGAGDGMSAALSGASFASVTAPVGFGSLRLAVNGVLVDNDFNAGETFVFGAGVTQFNLYGGGLSAIPPIGPPLFANVTMQLSYTGAPSSMTWTSADALPVPETSTFSMILLGVVALGVVMGGWRRKPS